MNDEQLDGLFEQPSELRADLARRVREQIQRDTQPVKPLMSSVSLWALFMGMLAAGSVVFAAVLKFKGLQVLTVEAAIVFLAVIAGLGLWGAVTVATSMRPAAGRLLSLPLSVLALIGYEAMVFGFFRDYSAEAFVHQGMACLGLGVLCGVVVGVPIWVVVRQGFVVEPVRAGAAIGLVSGLSGIGFLTMHCPVLTVPHAGVWHALVVVVCAGGGAILGRMRLGWR